MYRRNCDGKGTVVLERDFFTEDDDYIDTQYDYEGCDGCEACETHEP